MEIINVKAKNFLSFKELDYTFSQGNPILMVGENLTDSGQESNGSGKSVFSIVVEYCLLHTTSKGVTDAELVHWGETEAEVSLTMYCPIRKQTLLIERKIAIKGGGSSQLSVNGVAQYKFTDKVVDLIDKFVIEWIGITKEDLQNFFILSKFKYTSFFSASNTALIALIGRFSNSSIIAGIDKDILDKLGSLNDKTALLLEQKNKLYGKIEVHKQNLETERTIDKGKLVEDKLAEIDNKIIENSERIVNIHTQIGTRNDTIYENEELLLSKLMEVQKAQAELTSLGGKTFDEEYERNSKESESVKQQKESVEESLKKTKKTLDDTKLMLAEIDLDLKGSVVCPKCSHKFNVSNPDIDIQEEENTRADLLELLPTFDSSIDKLRTTIQEFEPKLKSIRLDRLTIEAAESEFATLKRNLNNSLTKISNDKNSIETSITTLNNEITSLMASIKLIELESSELAKSKLSVTVDSFDNSERIKAIDEQITVCEFDVLTVDTEIKKVEDEIFTHKQWALTFKEFTQWLSVKTLKILEGYANKYLDDIKSDLRVSLEGYKMKTDGTLSDKITAYIIRNGEKHNFKSFSGGERCRLEAAMILTIQNAINSTHKFSGLNFVSIDEIFESCDGKGISTLTTALMGIGKTMVITTHVPGTNYDCPVLKVVKKDNVSTLIQ